MRLSFLACALGVALVSDPAAADIYAYTDRDGVVHYTNLRPKGRGWRKVFSTPRSKARSPLGRHRSRSRANDPYRYIRYDPYIEEAALLYQLPESFLRAIVRVESNFHPDAVSPDGATGLMQLMPATAARMGVQDPYDPRQNLLGGARFLRILANEFNGDLVLTLAAYNAGQGAVMKYGGVPPYSETRRYVQNVLQYYYAFRAGESS